VTHGWSGKGAGDDFCNTCQCNDGALACTKKACDKCSLVKCGSGTTCKDGQCVNTKKETCTNGKTTVDHGWSGAGDGDNACNKCSCNSGSLFCTKRACSIDVQPTDAAPTRDGGGRETTVAPTDAAPTDAPSTDAAPTAPTDAAPTDTAVEGVTATVDVAVAVVRVKGSLKLRLTGRKLSGLAQDERSALKTAVRAHVAKATGIDAGRITKVALSDANDGRRARAETEGGVIIAEVEVAVKDDAELAMLEQKLAESAPAKVWELTFVVASAPKLTTAAADDVTTVAKGVDNNSGASAGEAKGPNGGPTEAAEGGSSDGGDSTTVVIVVLVLVILAVVVGVVVGSRMRGGSDESTRQNTFENPTYAQPDGFAEHVSAVDYRANDANVDNGPRNRMDSVC